MTQEVILKALQDGPLSSLDICNLTGMTRATVLSTAQTLRKQGLITSSKIKVNRCWLAQYTLTSYVQPEDEHGVKMICGIPTYGIFTRSEYKAMYAHARRIYGVNPSFASKTKVVTSENNRQV
jgi:predicted transcriptional regulator